MASGSQSQAIEQIRQRLKASGGRTPEPPAEFKAEFESAAQQAGIDTEKLSGLSDKIGEAISGALDGLNGNSDPREAIESAVNGVLKDNGIDPEKLKEQLKSVGEKLGYGQGGPPGFGGFGGPGGPGGAGGFPGFGGLQGPGGGFGGGMSAMSNQNQSVQTLLSSLGKKKDGDSSSGDSNSLLDYLKNLPQGSLVDANA
jgi:hypothetical protein